MIEENMKFYKGSTFTINRIESIKRNDVLYTHTHIYIQGVSLWKTQQGRILHTEMDLAHFFHTFFHIYNTCLLLSFLNQLIAYLLNLFYSITT